MKKEKIIIYINQVANYLSEDLIKAFLSSGKYDKVVAFVGNPENISINDDRVIIEKIHRYDRSSFIKRSWSWVAGSWQSLWKIMTKYRKCDLFLVSNPPTISFITLFTSNHYSTLIYDIYPDGLVPTFLSSRNLIIRLWKKFNQSFYKKAQNIYTITDGMAERLSQYVDISRIKVVPLWHLDNLHPINKEDNHFLTSHGLKDKFIILYSGNIGKGHNVDIIPELAYLLKNETDIRFVIIGEGWMKKELQERVSALGLDSVLFLPYQPINLLSESLSSADLSFVSVGDEGATICVPSKTYNNLAVGTAILGFANRKSELYRIIETHNAGRVFDFGELEEAANFIKTIKANKNLLIRYKNNAKALSKFYTKENAFQMI